MQRIGSERLPKVAFLIVILAATFATASTAAEKVCRDDLLHRRYGSFEDVTLAQIYLALPQELFEGTFQQRIEALIGGRVQFRANVLPRRWRANVAYGSGDHSNKGKAYLHVTGESEGKMFWKLERIANGWKAEEKHLE